MCHHIPEQQLAVPGAGDELGSPGVDRGRPHLVRVTAGDQTGQDGPVTRQKAVLGGADQELAAAALGDDPRSAVLGWKLSGGGGGGGSQTILGR